MLLVMPRGTFPEAPICIPAKQLSLQKDLGKRRKLPRLCPEAMGKGLCESW